MKVSLLLLTMNRTQITGATLNRNFGLLRQDEGLGSRFETEFLWCDQGSTEPGMMELVEKYPPDYFRANKTNEGVARSQNQLFLRATGDYLMFFPQDIFLPPGWLSTFIRFAQLSPNPGIIGMEGTREMPACVERHGFYAYHVDEKTNPITGVMFFPRKVVDTIGGMHEEFHPYGGEDSDFSLRAGWAGFHNFFIPFDRVIHVGEDMGQDNEYRRMKTACLEPMHALLERRKAAYETRGVFEPLPPLRDAL